MIESIDLKDLKTLNKATEQIHVAVQFLSMAGEFLTKKKEDGSHANMGWLSMKEKFITHPFGPKEEFVMELSPSELTLTIFNTTDNVKHELLLKGKTQIEGTRWIKEKLKLHKIEGASNYKISIPYQLPDYANYDKKKFKRSPKKAFIAFSKIRSWGEYFVQKHRMQFEESEEPRTWPHHFDHASLVSLAQQKDGTLTKSMGLGLAIHDSMIDEHYFYVSTWQKGKDLDLSKMKALQDGEWKNDGFKGSVLKISEIAGKEDFEKRIDDYFSNSIEQILKLQKYKPKNGK